MKVVIQNIIVIRSGAYLLNDAYRSEDSRSPPPNSRDVS